jgi:hypothetical protein
VSDSDTYKSGESSDRSKRVAIHGIVLQLALKQIVGQDPGNHDDKGDDQLEEGGEHDPPLAFGQRLASPAFAA